MIGMARYVYKSLIGYYSVVCPYSDIILWKVDTPLLFY